MEKKGLGKGLGALIPGADSESRPSGTEIELSRISHNPYQPRTSLQEDRLQELVDSVRVHGILQPIVVRSKGGGEYELVAGERRLRAAQAAGLTRIPAVVRELTNEQSIEIALVENLQREDINPIDAAHAYRRLIDEFNLTQEEIAFELGRSRSSIANTLRLLTLPDEIRDSLKEGTLTEGHARAILSIDDRNDQSEVFKRVAALGLSVRDTERLARRWKKVGGEALRRENVSRETALERRDPNILEVEAQLRQIFGTKVSVVMHQYGGRIQIEFYSEEDFHRVLALLCGG